LAQKVKRSFSSRDGSSTVTNKSRLSILDVGHGNCAVLECGGGVTVIDAGPGSSLLEFLVREGISSVDTVLISHADEDHIAGLVALLASGEISISNVRLNGDSQKESAIWDDLLFELSARDSLGELNFYPLLASGSEDGFVQGDGKIEVVGPGKYLVASGVGSRDREGRRIGTNSISSVLKVIFRGRAVALLPGDVDEVGLADLVSRRASAEAEILVFPHHGGKSGGGDLSKFAKEIARLVRPKVVIFSIGRGKHGTPRPEIIESLREEVPGVWIACTQLSDHCAANLPNEVPTHLASVFSRGREQRKCCAGTLTIALESGSRSILPLHSLHQEFITISAPTALCRKGRGSAWIN
jgi:beta-lactamase superfamily II metal-dependent hydrolase